MAKLLLFSSIKGSIYLKKILLSLILIIGVQSQANERYFENTNASVQNSDLASTVLEGHRVLSLMARMSVYAFHCGNQSDHNRFSQVYRSLFTEQSRGMVSYESQTFANPIEGMRNVAVLRFLQLEQSLAAGRQLACDQNRAEFHNFLYMSSNQIKAYARLNLTEQHSYLNTVRSVAVSAASSNVQPVEQPEIQIDPDVE